MKTCQICQHSFDTDRVPEGMCPVCLLADCEGPSAHSSGHGDPAWTPPTVEVMQALLPAYTWVKLIGRGGMGAVYLARQPSLDRPVAIKVLPVLPDEHGVGFVQRFKNEARLMAGFSHPGIVQVYDLGELPGGMGYFVMEYVEGTDVAQMMKAAGGRLPPVQAASIVAEICAALHHAHGKGVVHRDIKPANVLISAEGGVKIVDFGLAKHSAPAEDGATVTGLTLGTPDFAAPEMRVAHGIVDGRADLYAAGVMLYNMLTGSIPRGVFQNVGRQVPGAGPLDAVIRKAMSADRDHRYATAGAMRAAVLQAMRPRSARPLRLFCALAAAVTLLGLGAVLGPHIFPPATTAADSRLMVERLAEWVFSKGGALIVRPTLEGAKALTISSASQLPAADFVIEELHFKGISTYSPRITAEELVLWVPYMPRLKRFLVEDSPKLLRSLNPAGLRELGRLIELESLSLEGMDHLRDEDLALLSPCNKLLHLSLAKCSIDGTGFTHLRRTLVRLNVQGCPISAAGWAELRPFARLQFLKASDDFLPNVKRNTDGFIKRPELDAHFFLASGR